MYFVFRVKNYTVVKLRNFRIQIIYQRKCQFSLCCRLISWKTLKVNTLAIILLTTCCWENIVMLYIHQVTLLSSVYLLWLKLVNCHFVNSYICKADRYPSVGVQQGGLIDRSPLCATNTQKTPAEGTHTNNGQKESMLPKGFSHVNLGQINWLTHTTR